jgi:hypothetical protein
MKKSSSLYCNTVATKGEPKTLQNRVGIILIYVIMKINKEALISQILAEKSANPVGGAHCSNCGHCSSTL